MRVQGKFVIITGGASGIGAATARLFAREGACVGILDRDFGSAEERVDEISASSGIAAAWACDVSDPNQVRQCVSRAVGRFGPIDILFNNAGIAIRRTVTETEPDDWDRVIETNLRGTYLCSKFCLEHFRESGGSIVHSSSVTGITGVRNRAAYSAAKGALTALTRSMAMDLAERRIRVNCVCPGFVRTPLIEALLSDPVRSERLLAMHPLGRLGLPEDVAHAVLFLASQEAEWITGISLVVDGGFSAGKADEI
jgi:meso-butanediol dehydrogenase / (S,S)-butanediol dehydrogenase / diacetyl reductase